jgi:hypothetical protein
MREITAEKGHQPLAGYNFWVETKSLEIKGELWNVLFYQLIEHELSHVIFRYTISV